MADPVCAECQRSDVRFAIVSHGTGMVNGRPIRTLCIECWKAAQAVPRG